MRERRLPAWCYTIQGGREGEGGGKKGEAEAEGGQRGWGGAGGGKEAGGGEGEPGEGAWQNWARPGEWNTLPYTLGDGPVIRRGEPPTPSLFIFNVLKWLSAKKSFEKKLQKKNAPHDPAPHYPAPPSLPPPNPTQPHSTSLHATHCVHYQVHHVPITRKWLKTPNFA